MAGWFNRLILEGEGFLAVCTLAGLSPDEAHAAQERLRAELEERAAA